MAEPPVCDCHGTPKTWVVRTGRNGYWLCMERVRETARRRYAENPKPKREQVARRFRARYESDPVWRIERNLKRAREKRAATIERRRQQPRESD